MDEDAYRRRLVDDELDELFPHLPAVLLDGPKGVGKTATALRRGASIIRLDRDADRDVAAADVDHALARARPVVVDEWHRLPAIWDAVKRAVDADGSGGQFLLTGSPPVPGGRTHSGAGRIISMQMRPMTLLERGVSPDGVSLAGLLEGSVAEVDRACDLGLADYLDAACASGFPGIMDRPERVRARMLDDYIARIAEREVEQVTGSSAVPSTLLAWLASYAAHESTTASYAKVRDAASSAEAVTPAKTTTIRYVDALRTVRVLDPIDAWLPSGSQPRALGRSPKHHVVDPALTARLLGLDAGAVLAGRQGDRVATHGGRVLGALFEGLVAMHAKVFAQAIDAKVRHLRTHGGDHEVDLLVVAPDGRLVAIEVKAAVQLAESDVQHLLWLREQVGDTMVAGVVVHAGPRAYRRKDGILVVPLGLLAP